MKKQLCILFLLLTSHAFVNAQDTSFPQGELMLLDGDSIPTYGIPLKEVVLFQPLRFKTRLELKRYLILRRKTLKVYPYAKLAADRLTILNERLNNLDNKRSRKKYLKRMEKFIYEEFEQELKKFSRSEGKILIRLVHRQTGTTTYDLVKELRTGWKAFWYETTASLFKLSLKDTFDPEYSFEDYLIEDILQRAFADQYLEEQASSLDYNLDDLYYIWKDKK
ncbi:MAG: DUF4294 domain-containing protein [Flavobacteriaceae bacterium]|nr:DUF4294 domain-containing protein [Flavobacteriaceae bacterium]